MMTNQTMYNALINKDASFEGTFIAAVKTTGIFCRPSCTAKKPKKENVEFFPSTKQAILSGYRPCKICHPLEKMDETPAYVKNILAKLQEDPSLKFKDWNLRERNIDPIKIRRWFLKHHGITFHAYQRMFRINTAFKKIQAGKKITDTAFDAGYESLSGFGDSFKSVFGISPSAGKQKQIVDVKRLETPLGVMFAGATLEGICLLEFSDRRMLETQFKKLAKYLNATIAPGDNPHFAMLEKQLQEYFAGERRQFSVPLHTPGTKFQQDVWKQLQTIPYGKTRSYKEQAIAIKAPAAVRAVATANGMNRISIVIPCHRVIGHNGQLAGYGGGVWRKKKLLELENFFLQKK